MKLGMLNVGSKVRYGNLCEVFGVEKKTGKSKILQLKDFERYIRLEKEGVWFHILEVYDTPLEKVDNRKYNGKHENSLKALEEHRHVQPRRQNSIILLDDYAELVISDKESTYTVLIDLDDVDRIAERSWGVSAYGYVCSSEKVMLHRFVTGVGKLNEDYSPDRIVVHHINHNKLDNRKCNLQVMTEGEHIKLHSNERRKTSTAKKSKPSHNVRKEQEKKIATSLKLDLHHFMK